MLKVMLHIVGYGKGNNNKHVIMRRTQRCNTYCAVCVFPQPTLTACPPTLIDAQQTKQERHKKSVQHTYYDYEYMVHTRYNRYYTW